jgi:integrase
MPRRAEPFPHQGYFKTSFGGRQRILCRIEDGIDAAREELRKLQSEQFRTGRLAPDMTVAEAAALFLREIESDKGPEHRTFLGYRRNLQRFVERLGPRKLRSLTAGDGVEYKRFLRDDAQTKITGRRPGQKLGNVRPPQPLGTVTINHHLRAAKAVLNWAVENDLLVKSPWRKKKVKLLTENGRRRVITPEEFDRLLQACSDEDVFRDILWAMRLTAARPEDIRHLTWEMVKWAAHCWEIPPDLHKTGDTQTERKPRIVPMVSQVEDILRRRQTESKSSHVFPKHDGQPWTPAGLSQKFMRLRKKAGIVVKGGEGLVLYSSRHTRLTELATELPASLLQDVAGHTTFQMTRRYLHTADQTLVEKVQAAQDRLDQPK